VSSRSLRNFDLSCKFQVRQIVRTRPGLKRISFVAHSLGGLFQRYAIGDLYKSGDSTIAGLEPVTFVTMATPHLGMRGSKSVRSPLELLPTRTLYEISVA
jgi:hypothetical protein